MSLAVPGTALAQQATSPPQQTAEEVAERAYQEQAAAEYSDAVGSYLEAYKLSGASVILFNVATIYDRKLHEVALASEYYRRYLSAADADPELARKATKRLELFKEGKVAPAILVPIAPIAMVPPPEALPPTPAAPPLPPLSDVGDSDRGRGWRTAGLVVGAAGVVALGASAALAAFAVSENGDANAYCAGSACRDPRGVADARDAGSAANAGTISLVGGVVMLAAGVGMYVLSPAKRGTTGSIGGGRLFLRVGAAHGASVLGVAF